MKSTLLFLLTGLCFFFPAYSQIEFPPLSHYTTLTQRVGHLHISLAYERPSLRGRDVFNELVPYEKVWRTGAGYATKIRFSHAVGINGQTIAPGTYSVYTIPRPETWTFILNADTTLYGAYGYDESQDVLRMDVAVQPSNRTYETLTYDLDIIPYTAYLYISWDQVQVRIPIETFTEALVEAQIDSLLLTRESTDPEDYAGAADYLLWQNKEYEKALWLAQVSEELETSLQAYSLQVELLTALGKKQEAIQIAHKAIAFAETIFTETRDLEDAQGYFEEKLRRLNE